jgi:hypothetical protein
MTQFVSSPHASKRRPLAVCNTTFVLLPLHASRCPFLILTKMCPNSACDKLARVGDANGEAHRTRLPGSAFCLLCCASVASDQQMPLCRHLSLVVPTCSETQPYYPSRCLSGERRRSSLLRVLVPYRLPGMDLSISGTSTLGPCSWQATPEPPEQSQIINEQNPFQP